MKIIGITGGIGSGKSTVCKIFETLEIPVFDADFEAKKFYENEMVVKELFDTFGDEIVGDGNNIDLKKVTQIVFKDSNKLQLLNSIIHPKLKDRFDFWCEDLKDKKYVIKEAAVMIESGTYKQCDEIILVTSPFELRIERVMQRNNILREEVLTRINNQMTDDGKLKFVQHQILNDEHHSLISQVLALHEKFIATT